MNVLLLTIDSLRADRVLGDNDLTPGLDAFGDGGASFTQAITHGHGTPVAFPAILSGTYPMLYGGVGSLSAERPILARHLREAGYETAAFTSNPHLFERYGYEVGFDEFNEYRHSGSGGGSGSVLDWGRRFVKRHVDHDSRVWNLLRRGYYLAMTATEQRPYTPADAINDHVLDWLDARDPGRPFFGWVHYMDAHYPFYSDERRLREVGADRITLRRQRRLNRLMNESPDELGPDDVADLRALYDAEVRFADEQFRSLLDGLAERGLREETLVIVTSDHGEGLGEHGRFGHYSAPWEELVRVPLAVDGPAVEDAEVTEQVGLADIAPTVLDYADVDHDAPFSGRSLRPAVEGGERGGDERLILGHGAPLGCRTERWKYVWWERDGDEPVDAELYDLEADPEETTDVRDDHPDVAETFDAFLAEHVRHARETDASTRTEDPDEDVKAQLEALGYR